MLSRRNIHRRRAREGSPRKSTPYKSRRLKSHKIRVDQYRIVIFLGICGCCISTKYICPASPHVIRKTGFGRRKKTKKKGRQSTPAYRTRRKMHKSRNRRSRRQAEYGTATQQRRSAAQTWQESPRSRNVAPRVESKHGNVGRHKMGREPAKMYLPRFYFLFFPHP